ncbi:GNAT family N-acetyltransferase [Microbacterium sp. T32]|uniref:GNAT family N-acetyltransferase n=1 Tax=Microbacterium sp. T32 TaxID=1776083 RepID=UPI0007ABCF5D|nr:GNAT family N-acetyltransferase [Microbacterium sp. T32]KZE39213.1 histone acetyltransferase [Microbacterium sp. T32]
MTEFLTPRPIAAGDKLSEFRSGEEVLDVWLRTRARSNEKTGASRTSVSVTRGEQRVAGYYCLSSSSLEREDGPAELTARMPSSVPVVLLGRLAIDQEFHGMGLGFSLLQHATLRALEAAETIGIRAILVHALGENVVPFYEKFGFTRFPGQSRTLYLLTKDARATLGEF